MRHYDVRQEKKTLILNNFDLGATVTHASLSGSDEN